VEEVRAEVSRRVGTWEVDGGSGIHAARGWGEGDRGVNKQQHIPCSFSISRLRFLRRTSLQVPVQDIMGGRRSPLSEERATFAADDGGTVRTSAA
jgi:hypothetical protein